LPESKLIHVLFSLGLVNELSDQLHFMNIVCKWSWFIWICETVQRTCAVYEYAIRLLVPKYLIHMFWLRLLDQWL